MVIIACSDLTQRGQPVVFGSADDVQAVLELTGGSVPVRDCANVRHDDGSAIRTIACTTTLSGPVMRKLTRVLKLRPGPAFHDGMIHACESRPGLRSGDPGVDVLAGENPSVPNGIGAVRIQVVRATGAACVEATYPWSS